MIVSPIPSLIFPTLRGSMAFHPVASRPADEREARAPRVCDPVKCPSFHGDRNG
ncbi:MAG: hypothetical protein QHC65_06520 [Sphingomonas sp.]|nr:hypothetical protein [Sphingomonas sp.]MDX3884057.1 hypothetical protein [Sphingomonas sp.]